MQDGAKPGYRNAKMNSDNRQNAQIETRFRGGEEARHRDGTTVPNRTLQEPTLWNADFRELAQRGDIPIDILIQH